MQTKRNFRTNLTLTLMAISMLVTGPVLGSILPATLNADVVVEAGSEMETARTTAPRLSIWQRFKARRQQRRLQRAAARRARYADVRRPRTTLGRIARAPFNGAKRIVSGVKRMLQRAEKKRGFRAVTGVAAVGGGVALAGGTMLGSTVALWLIGGVHLTAVVVPVLGAMAVGMIGVAGLYASYRMARWGVSRTWRELRGKKS